MSIGFDFTAELQSRDAFLKTLGELAAQYDYSFSSGDDWAQVSLCRMGDLQFTFAEQDDACPQTASPSKGEWLSAECITSMAGPGFHAAAIDFSDALAEAAQLKLLLDDETDYYDHRNFELMRSEHFYSWLLTMVDVCRRENEEASLSNFCICWDVDQYVPEDIPGTVVSPAGRFHIDKMVDQVQNEGIEAFAREFFLWNERERDGRFYRNTALSILWEDCYFMPGDRSDIDRKANQAFLKYLEKAARLDPSLPMPKAEYALVCELENRTPIDLSAFPDYEPDYPAGYRRGRVSYRLGNTDFLLPGCFLREEEEQDTLWYDGGDEDWKSLRATALRINEGEVEFSDKLFNDTAEPPEEFRTGDGLCRAAFAGEIQDDGSVYYQSIAQVICAKQITLLTASYSRREDAAWAMALFREIRSHRKVDE